MFRSIAFVSVIALVFFGDITVSCPDFDEIFTETENADIKELFAGMPNAKNNAENEDACLEVFKFVERKNEKIAGICHCFAEHPFYPIYTQFCNDEGHAFADLYDRNMAGNDKVVDADEPVAARFETFML